MSDPELHQEFVDRVVDPFRGMLRLFIERGIERGELRPDLEVEPLVDLLHSIPIYKILMSRRPARSRALGVPAAAGPRNPQLFGSPSECSAT